MTTIVDRSARNRAAQALRDFVSGKISNDEFVNAEPASDDPAIRQIWNAAWFTYDDLKKHRLVGRYRLQPAARREVLRWILFLDNDFPYVWPPRSNPQGALVRDRESRISKLLGHKHQPFHSVGNTNAWPFVRMSDEKTALGNPKRLRGPTPCP